MRILLFSDIHGNAVALEAVLTDSLRHGPYDLTICAGDLAWAGPRPAEVFARVRELCNDDPTGQSGGGVCVYGNCDQFLLCDTAEGAPQDKNAERFARQQAWMLGKLNPADLAFLQRMPFNYQVTPLPGQELLIVHANPRNVDDALDPNLNDTAVDGVVGDAEFQVLAFGHVHLPSVRLWRGRLLVNVSSVGLPMDGDPRAAYSVFTWQGGGWQVAQYRVEYDAPRVAREMARNGLPRGRHFAERLLAARYR